MGLSDANLSKWELCELIQRHVPDLFFTSAEVGHDPDQRNYIVSNQRIEAAGYKTSLTLDEGVDELLKGYQVIRRTGYGNV